ncbi:RadC family protein [Rhodothermus bifroesti]|jgi:DNA repair protein RadC
MGVSVGKNLQRLPMAGQRDSATAPQLRYQVPIRQWDEADRPREKFMRRGPSVLSDAELIALIFGSGTRTRTGTFSAVQLGQALLRTYGSLYSLAQRDLKELTHVAGIGPAKAVQLMAAFEIGRRVEAQRPGQRIQVRTPADVVACYGPLLRDLKREVFKIVLLNTANYILADYTISEGGLAASIVEPRAVFHRAILDHAASIICLHNHPSGNPEPSREDLQLTRQLVEAGRLLGIPVQDHIIIAGTTYTSLAERGLMG